MFFCPLFSSALSVPNPPDFQYWFLLDRFKEKKNAFSNVYLFLLNFPHFPLMHGGIDTIHSANIYRLNNFRYIWRTYYPLCENVQTNSYLMIHAKRPLILVFLRCTFALQQVGTISANGEREVGELLARAMEKVGKEGVISVAVSTLSRFTTAFWHLMISIVRYKVVTWFWSIFTHFAGWEHIV